MCIRLSGWFSAEEKARITRTVEKVYEVLPGAKEVEIFLWRKNFGAGGSLGETVDYSWRTSGGQRMERIYSARPTGRIYLASKKTIDDRLDVRFETERLVQRGGVEPTLPFLVRNSYDGVVLHELMHVLAWELEVSEKKKVYEQFERAHRAKAGFVSRYAGVYLFWQSEEVAAGIKESVWRKLLESGETERPLYEKRGQQGVASWRKIQYARKARIERLARKRQSFNTWMKQGRFHHTVLNEDIAETGVYWLTKETTQDDKPGIREKVDVLSSALLRRYEKTEVVSRVSVV